MKLKSTGQAGVGVPFRLFFLASLAFSSLGGRESVMASCRHSVSQMCGLIYRVYIRQLLCTSAYYFPRPLSGLRP